MDCLIRVIGWSEGGGSAALVVRTERAHPFVRVEHFHQRIAEIIFATPGVKFSDFFDTSTSSHVSNRLTCAHARTTL
jgi:hypothetical protein